MLDCDVIVCGGGPAGLAAAIACQAQGMNVMVAECARPPIEKACGEGLLPDALCALDQLGVSLNSVPGVPFEGIAFIDGNSEPIQGRFSNGPARGVRRTELHAALCRRAEQTGVDLRWGTYVTGMQSRADGVEVSTRLGTLRAKWCIGADGLRSQVRRWSGLERGGTRSMRIGVRRHYSVQPWSSFTEVYWGRFGQVYVTPTANNEVSVAVIRNDRCGSVGTAVDEFPRLSERLRGLIPSSTDRGAATCSRHLPQVTTARVALVGDASGSVDAVTGSGMSLAFQQALAVVGAMRQDDVGAYERAHREIRRSAGLLSELLLQLGRFPALRRFAFASFRRDPKLFEAMLALHSGAAPFSYWGANGALTLGLQTLLG